MGEARQHGFSLVELLVVTSLLVILLGLMLPAYQRQLIDTRRTLGGAALLEAMMRQEQYFLDHRRYAEVLTELDYPSHPYAIDGQGTVLHGHDKNRVYLINLATRATAYTLSATPQFAQAADGDCGVLSLDSSGVKRSSGEGRGRPCW
ncbi:MAG: prepilin-type N-terminal cleavage/methylation domain-containing protein [Halioglobus sp.]|nr:prepilin-type N-terminal cleavage/methylation domain-containing protein [Halioglobus sp.]